MKRSAIQMMGLIAASAFMLVACEGPSADDAANPTDDSSAQVAPETSIIPAGLFVSDVPDSPLSLAEAKNGAAQGDRVVFEARVGGRAEAFIDGRAMFFVADPSLLSCDQLHGDACKTPWDYCCEDPANLRRHMATIQVVDADGRPLKLSLHDEHGLAPLKSVVVSGIVDQIDDEGTFVVNADMLYVRDA